MNTLELSKTTICGYRVYFYIDFKENNVANIRKPVNNPLIIVFMRRFTLSFRNVLTLSYFMGCVDTSIIYECADTFIKERDKLLIKESIVSSIIYESVDGFIEKSLWNLQHIARMKLVALLIIYESVNTFIKGGGGSHRNPMMNNYSSK